jgi:ribose transport system permease protein
MSTTTKPAASRKFSLGAMIQVLGMLPILILLGILFQFLSGWAEGGSLASAWGDGRFMSLQNLSIVLQQASINTVLAAGMTVVILTAGIDLSVGSILAASAMVAVLASKIDGWGMLGVPAALVCGALFGLLNGVLIAFLKRWAR